MASLPATRSWKTGTAAMLVAAAPVFGFWKYYVTVMKAEILISESRLSELRSSTAKAAATAGQVQQLRQQVARLERDVEPFERAIPARKDLAGLLEAVDALAVRSNLRVRRFVPQPVKEHSPYAEVSYKLQVDGKYQDLAALFESIGSVSPKVSVRDLTISSKVEQPDEGLLRAECLLSTIVLSAATSQPPLAASTSRSDAPRHPPAVATARDPFATPSTPLTESTAVSRGLESLHVDDISVKGIVRDAAGFHALVQASDKRTFIARAGQTLLDAVVKDVTGDAIVFTRTADKRQPAGSEVHIVRKLRPAEGVRQ